MRRPPVSRPRTRHAPARRARGTFAAIWRVVRRIPRGRVATYGQVARMAGYPGAARMAGWALGALPSGHRIEGREVPWHRVINAAGRTSPRAGDATGECRRQIERLGREGVVPGPGGVIDLERYGWDGRTAAAGASVRDRRPAAVAGGIPPRRSNCSSQSRV